MDANTKEQLAEYRRLDKEYQQAKTEMHLIKRKRDAQRKKVEKLMATQLVRKGKQYVGQWIYARGIKPGQLNHAEMLIKPTKFTVHEWNDGTFSAYVHGIILYRYPELSDYGKKWKLLVNEKSRPDEDSEEKRRIPALYIFGNLETRIKFRKATKKEINSNLKAIKKAELEFL
jgi:hypothetical protein